MKILAIAATTAALLCMVSSSSHAQFREGGNWLGVNLTLVTDPIGFGADFEHGMSPNFGLGGMIRYWGRSYSYYYGDVSWSIIMPQVVGYYHFMPGERVDPFLGGRLGYVIYSESYPSGITYSATSGGVILSVAGGIRYFFSPKISGTATGELFIGHDYWSSTLGLVAGIDFTL